MSSEEFRHTPMYRAMSRQEHSALDRIAIGDGLSLLVSPHDLSNRSLLETGDYEPHLARALDAAIRPGHTVFCVGANVGYHAVRAARAVGPSGRVVALEANPRTARQLCHSFALNGLSNAIVLPVAAADREAAFRYVRAQGTNGYVEATDAAALDELATAESIVQGVTLDALARAWSPVDVLQLDVEGAEGLVLRGASDLLRRFRPVIFGELCLGQLRRTSGIDGRELLAPLVELGYELAVLGFDGTVFPFAGDVDRLVAHAASQPTGHVDVRCTATYEG
jgi:FkbM family methyltransferase